MQYHNNKIKEINLLCQWTETLGINFSLTFTRTVLTTYSLTPFDVSYSNIRNKAATKLLAANVTPCYISTLSKIERFYFATPVF